MSPWLLIVPVACAALALKAAHEKREHDRRLTTERQRFVNYVDAWRSGRVQHAEAIEAIEEWLRA